MVITILRWVKAMLTVEVHVHHATEVKCIQLITFLHSSILYLTTASCKVSGDCDAGLTCTTLPGFSTDTYCVGQSDPCLNQSPGNCGRGWPRHRDGPSNGGGSNDCTPCVTPGSQCQLQSDCADTMGMYCDLSTHSCQYGMCHLWPRSGHSK